MASGTSFCKKRNSKCFDAVEDEDTGRPPIAEYVGKRAEERHFALENQLLQQLLPGIPDDITLNHITTKLSWTDCFIVPSLGHAWNRVIQSRQVHYARVRSQSTETLVVVKGREFIALYSMKAKTFYALPSIPGVDLDNLEGCKCVCLGDRVYILGGMVNEWHHVQLGEVCYHIPHVPVYVLELVGQWKWRKCADVPQPLDQECGIMDEKIYTFEGLIDGDTVSVVYDPRGNSWSSTTTSKAYPLWGHHVALVGGALFLHHGEHHNSDSAEDVGPFRDDRQPETLLSYPVRNYWWNKVEKGLWLLDSSWEQQVFVANGEFYVMTLSAIHRLDTEKITAEVHSFSLAGVIMDEKIFIALSSVLAANGELLALVWWFSVETVNFGSCLLQSSGFGGTDRVIVWEMVNCSQDFGHYPCMCPLKL